MKFLARIFQINPPKIKGFRKNSKTKKNRLTFIANRFCYKRDASCIKKLLFALFKREGQIKTEGSKSSAKQSKNNPYAVHLCSSIM